MSTKEWSQRNQFNSFNSNKGLLYAILAVQAAGLAWMVLAFIFR